MAVMYNFTLVQFLVNTFENQYVSAIGVGLSDMLGYFIGGWCFYKLGLTGSLGLSFIVSIIGGILVMLIGLRDEKSWFFPILVSIAKLGISIAY